jgi:hypothetical protein
MTVTQHAIDKRALVYGKVENTERQFMPVLVDSQGRIILSGVPSGGALESTSQTILSYLGTPVSTDLAIIKNKTNLIPADIATQLDTNIPAIKAKTNLTNATSGTFTTSSATVPADTSKTEGVDYWAGADIVPMSGAAAWQMRKVKSFASGVFTLWEGFSAAPGLVGYILIPDRKRAFYETVSYAPGLITSGDLEAATKTITATSEGAVADYTSALTLPMGCTVNGVAKVIGTTETRLQIMRIGTRSSITPDSFNAGCTSLRCRIYVDTQDANHLLQDITIASAANALTVADCLVGTREVIFNLLKDNAAHNFLFFFWVNSGNAVLSVVQVWETSLGGTGIISWATCASLTHVGLINIEWYANRLGTGTDVFSFTERTTTIYNYTGVSAVNTGTTLFRMSSGILYLRAYSPVAGDLMYITEIIFSLRSDN